MFLVLAGHAVRSRPEQKTARQTWCRRAEDVAVLLMVLPEAAFLDIPEDISGRAVSMRALADMLFRNRHLVDREWLARTLGCPVRSVEALLSSIDTRRE